MSSTKIKVYELAKELGLDGQHLVDVVQRLGIDVKNTMSVLGTEEVRTVREYYRKNRAVQKSVAAAQSAAKAAQPMTEKRVGATVIRRRAVDKKEATPPPAPARPAPQDDGHEMAEAVDVVAAEVEVQEPELEAPVHPAVTEAKAPRPEARPRPEMTAPAAPVETHAPPTAKASPQGQPAREPQAPRETMAPAAEAQGAQAAPPEPREAPKPVAPPAPRRVYPSIIKRTSADQHLKEIVGPKLLREKAPASPASAARPKPKPGTQPPATGTGLKRVKEVEVSAAPATDTSRDAGKRRTGQRQEAGAFRSTDYLKRELVHATKKRKNAIARPALKTQVTQAAAHKRVVTMAESIAVSELAREMGVKAAAVIGKLMGMGVTATINQSIDYDTASLVSHEFGYEVKQEIFKETDFVPEIDLAAESLAPRGPVVTIMGHVDHGKTSLLDAIRKTKVAAGEAGGITQHIGAYQVSLPKGKITFLDTPGHEAFTAMRARGAKVTDIVIIVVSAVDGVMPQTLESINHAKAANVPIIVAVNKVDLPDANPDRIKQTLAGHDLNPEEWGGDTIYVNVSAKTGTGIDKLLESILLQAELLELKANYGTHARGSIIESRLDKNRGPVATVLVQHGKLATSDIVVCGTTFGKVRALTNSLGSKVNEALPAEPVEILGLPEVPSVGDDLFVVEDERTARELTQARIDQKKVAAVERPKMSLEEMMAAAGGEKELRIILKADVQGSAEALKDALQKFPSEKAKVKLLHVGTGGIVESDVMLAAASRAVILGFNIRPDVKAQKLAEQERVELRTYSIIYDLLEDVRNLLEGLLDKTIKEKVIGRAEVREIFNVPKVGVIAGSAVIDGKVQRGCFLRLLRDSRVIYEGKISSLRRFKEDVKEVAQGFECGIGLENFNDLKLGDQFEAFLKEEIKGVL